MDRTIQAESSWGPTQTSRGESLGPTSRAATSLVAADLRDGVPIKPGNEVARTGVTESEAEAAGIDVVAATIKDRTRGGYYPDAGPIWVKLVAEAGSGRMLGGQIVGVEGRPSASMCSRPASAQGCRSWS